jgi:hypothetical protein
MMLNYSEGLLLLPEIFKNVKGKISRAYLSEGSAGEAGATSVLVIVPNRQYVSAVAEGGWAQTLLSEAQTGDDWWFSGPHKTRMDVLLGVRYDGKNDLLTSSSLRKLVSRIPSLGTCGSSRAVDPPVVVVATPGNAYRLLEPGVAPALGVVISVLNQPDVDLHLTALCRTGDTPRDMMVARVQEPEPESEEDLAKAKAIADYEALTERQRLSVGLGPYVDGALHLISPGPVWFKRACFWFGISVFVLLILVKFANVCLKATL